MAGFMDGFMKGYGWMTDLKYTQEDRERQRTLDSRADEAYEDTQLRQRALDASGEYTALYNQFGDKWVDTPEGKRFMQSSMFNDMHNYGTPPDVDHTELVDMVDNGDGTSTPVFRQTLADGSQSIGPGTANRSRDPNAPVLRSPKGDIDMMVRQHLGRYNPDFNKSFTDMRDRRQSEAAMDALFEGVQQDPATLPAQTTSPAKETPPAPEYSVATAATHNADTDAALIESLRGKSVQDISGGVPNITKEERTQLDNAQKRQELRTRVATMQSTLEKVPPRMMDAAKRRLSETQAELARLEASPDNPKLPPKIENKTDSNKVLNEAVNNPTGVSEADVAKALEVSGTPKERSLKNAQDTMKRLPKSGYMTPKMRKALITLAKTTPEHFPPDKVLNALRTGRLTSDDFNFINLGGNKVMRTNKSGDWSVIDLGAGSLSQKDALEIKIKEQQLANAQTKGLRDNLEGLARRRDGSVDEKLLNDMTRGLVHSGAFFKKNMATPQGMALAAEAAKIQHEFLEDNNAWYKFWNDDYEFNSYTPGLLAIQKNTSVENIVDEYYQPIRARVDQELSPSQLDRLVQLVYRLEETNMPRDKAIEVATNKMKGLK